jgi:hypothetical protein
MDRLQNGRSLLRDSLLVVIAMMVAGTSPLAGQAGERIAIGVSGGVLDNTYGRAPGTQAFWSVQLIVPLSTSLSFEPSVNHSRMDFGSGHGLTFADLQVHWLPTTGPVRPYLGVGVGGLHDALAASDGSLAVGFTVSGAAGVRVRVVERLGLRGEVRARTIPTGFVGRTLEAGAGILVFL